MRLEQFLSDSARRFPDKTSIVCDGERLTYGELERQSGMLAMALQRRGLARGDRVGIFMDNSAEAVIAIFAAAKAGAVFSPINASTKADKLAFILNNCRARALITQQKLLSVASEAQVAAPSVAIAVAAGRGTEAMPRGFEHWQELLRNDEGDRGLAFPGIDIDLAMLIYTSGSTGFPKGVMMTHRNVEAAATSITTYLESAPDDIVLCVLPLAFDYGLYQVLMSVKVGATVVLERSFAFPQAMLQLAAREKVTGLPLVPTMAALLLRSDSQRMPELPHLRYITNTAAALPPAHITRLQALFPQARLFSMYGLTECKRCTWLPPAELARRTSSVGIAIPGTEAYVVDEKGEKVGPNVSGELVIRGPHVMQGYWENEAATARALKPGPYPWEKVLYTGDLFRADEEGFLYFIGRKDDIIKSRGEKVSPKEVETVIHALPGVAEAVVIGVPDPVLGSAIKAVVVPDGSAPLTARDVISHCARFLEDFMVPKLVELVAELPKTDTGKISRRLVAEAEGARQS
jgi:amino acid adenylation domain-containing protein